MHVDLTLSTAFYHARRFAMVAIRLTLGPSPFGVLCKGPWCNAREIGKIT